MAKGRRPKSRAVPVDFSFITDKRLRYDVEDALDFSVYLIAAAEGAPTLRYKEEFYRAVVLYIASVVEALCLFLVKSKQLSRAKVEYKRPQVIHITGVKVTKGELVVALKTKVSRPIQDVPFAEAIYILQNSGLIPETLATDLNKVRIARNTQHLYARTRSGMSRKEIQDAFTALTNLLGVIARNP